MQVSSKNLNLINEHPVEITTPAQDSIILDVKGMKCAGCVKAVERLLLQHSGVLAANVNLATEVARVDCQTGLVDPTELAHRLSQAGFLAQARVSSHYGWLSSEPAETAAQNQRQEIQQQLRRLFAAGVLILLSGIGHFQQLGWGEVPFISNIWFHWGLATVALLGPGRAILVDGGRGLYHRIPNMNTLVGLGAISAYLASCVALLFPQLQWECFFDEPVMLLGFILLGRTLEQLARRRAAAALKALMGLQPQRARLIPDPQKQEPLNGSEEGLLQLLSDSVEIPIHHVRLGECLQVLPGEKVPVDGVVLAGQTTVDEAMITGEALPVLKKADDQVTAGTLNQSGVILVRATRTGADTTLAQIIHLVEEAQTRKAPVQQLADTVAGYFAYGVMAVAVLTFGFWYFAGIHLWPDVLMQVGGVGEHSHLAGENSHHVIAPAISPLLLSLKLAIAVLVIACPCSLGLATPTAILVGTGIGAERGLLIRGGDVLEQIHRLDTIVFDKTGTLTQGFPKVTDCLPTEQCYKLLMETPEFIQNLKPNVSIEDWLLQLAATVERGTRHPLAVAMLQEAESRQLSALEADNFHTAPGRGVRALVTNVSVVLGTSDWLQEQGITFDQASQDQGTQLATEGKTVVFMAVAGILIGLIACQDVLRTDAKATVDHLQQQGLRVMMLTGDQPEAAQAIAQQLGIQPADVISGVLPAGKAETIAQLQAQGAQVAMVGDGMNDAPALVSAQVGMALYSGTDVAAETAGVVLMHDQLMDVVKAIQLSRQTWQKIQQNLFWACGYNLLGIPIAAGVLLPSWGILLSPATAGALMAFSSVSVVVNSLLLRQFSKQASSL